MSCLRVERAVAGARASFKAILCTGTPACLRMSDITRSGPLATSYSANTTIGSALWIGHVLRVNGGNASSELWARTWYGPSMITQPTESILICIFCIYDFSIVFTVGRLLFIRCILCCVVILFVVWSSTLCFGYVTSWKFSGFKV